MTQQETTAFHAGLTAERVIDIAVELTREGHLYGWSIRDLARRLGVAPSVIYHHVGGKDLLARHVVERVVDTLEAPSADLEWDAWFREFLLSSQPVIVAMPGVAKWLILHGPTFPSVLPIIDTGIGVLLRAGFGDRAALAYTLLLNAAILTISVGDERLLHEDDGPRDHAAMMEEFRRATLGSPGLAALSEHLIQPFANGGEVAERQRDEYYRFVVDTTIAGLAASLS